ncbi:macrophage mannose receptor 1-like [Branchiostoma floridae]|uniref:Macrophage mannose receptor 1-like n=1 Tax=Branchiostoma floridae TaxID=7739 RepID=A0A9J7HVI2_BRAFL|nr:macrophage mannose receptor 1-like [Branchiostoma floridae]
MMILRAFYRVVLFLLAVGGSAMLQSYAAPEKGDLSIAEKVNSFVERLEELIDAEVGGDEDVTMDVMEKNDGESGGDSWLPQTRQAGCSSGYQMHNGICYKAFNTPKNFGDASSTCAADGGTLAMPKDAGTNAFLLSLKNAVHRPGWFWFGLVDQHQEGGWEWIDGTPLGSYRSWGPGEPNNLGDEDCAEYFPSAWNDAPCSKADRKFICQKIPAGCPDGYVYHQPSHLCYKAFNDKKTYNAAVATCASAGGTLAMPRDTATNKFLIYLKNAVDNNAWFRFGLTDHRQEGGWMWQDNVALGSFRAWGPGEPNNLGNEDCAEYFSGAHSSHSNTWNDGPCTRADRKFICQVAPSGCPSGYQQHGRNCFKAYGDKKSYDDAAAVCRVAGGSLAMPRDPATHQFLITLKNQVERATGFWLGFNDRSQEGGWRYADGTRLGSFQPWNTGEPNQYGGNEDCGMINRHPNNKWNDQGCSSQLNFICQTSLQVVESCGGNLPGSAGIFISPGYPQTYSDNQKCRWFINVPPGHVVRLTFLDFDLENRYDHVTVLDGCTNRELGKFTGTSRPSAVSSSGRTMEVVFTTDHSVKERGFKARYYAVAGSGKREMPAPEERELGEPNEDDEKEMLEEDLGMLENNILSEKKEYGLE